MSKKDKKKQSSLEIADSSSFAMDWIAKAPSEGTGVTAKGVSERLDEDIYGSLLDITNTLTDMINTHLKSFQKMLDESEVFADTMKNKETRCAFISYFARHYVKYRHIYGETGETKPNAIEKLNFSLTLPSLDGKRNPYAVMSGDAISDLYAREITSELKSLKDKELWENVFYMAKEPYILFSGILVTGRIPAILLPNIHVDSEDEDDVTRYLRVFSKAKERTSKSKAASVAATLLQLKEVSPAMALTFFMETLSPLGLPQTVTRGDMSSCGAAVQCARGSNSATFDPSPLFSDDIIDSWERKSTKNAPIYDATAAAGSSTLFFSQLRCYLASVSKVSDEAWALDVIHDLAQYCEDAATQRSDPAEVEALKHDLAAAAERELDAVRVLEDKEKILKEKDDQIAELESKIQNSREAELERENQELRSKIADMETAFRQVRESTTAEDASAEAEAEVKEPEEENAPTVEIFDKIPAPVIVGGHENFVANMRQAIPNIRIYQFDIPDDALKNASAIWVQHHNISHKFYYKVKGFASAHKIPFFYLEATSCSRCVEQMIQDASDILKDQEP